MTPVNEVAPRWPRSERLLLMLAVAALWGLEAVPLAFAALMSQWGCGDDCGVPVGDAVFVVVWAGMGACALITAWWRPRVACWLIVSNVTLALLLVVTGTVLLQMMSGQD